MKRVLIVFLLFISGCAHALSDDLRARVDEGFSAEQLFSDPALFKGKTVIVGGVVVSLKNEEKGSFMEVIQKPLDSRGRPEDTDLSRGRFVVFSKDFLDGEIYARGRRVTIGGIVTGTIEGTIDEMQYEYPVIEAEEIKLHRPVRQIPVSFSVGVWKSF